jgi:RHS repeat-associated protein
MTRFAYDGVNALAEYDGGNGLQRRYVFGPGIDNPIVQYEGSGTTDRRFMGKDEHGSIISLTDSAGALIAINRYDEYGKPQSTNTGRFQYTGQMWLSELGAYYYKARVYLPHLGIFAQTDPSGTDGGVNLYAYVLNDPINGRDPTGLECGTVTGSYIQHCDDDLVSALQDVGHLGASLVTVTLTFGGTGAGGRGGGPSLSQPSPGRAI